MVFVGSGLYSFDERSLCGVEDIRLVPLEEYGVHRHTLASDDVARVVGRLHGCAFDGHEEVCTLECRHDVSLTFVFECCAFVGECSSHCAEWYEWDAIGGIGCVYGFW